MKYVCTRRQFFVQKFGSAASFYLRTDLAMLCLECVWHLASINLAPFRRNVFANQLEHEEKGIGLRCRGDHSSSLRMHLLVDLGTQHPGDTIGHSNNIACHELAAHRKKLRKHNELQFETCQLKLQCRLIIWIGFMKSEPTVRRKCENISVVGFGSLFIKPIQIVMIWGIVQPTEIALHSQKLAAEFQSLDPDVARI